MKEKIIELLRQLPNSIPADISARLEMHPASVRKALTILRRQKRVTRRANGKYILWESAPAPVVVPREPLSGVDDAGRL